MTWEEYKENKEIYEDYSITNIECHICGDKIYKYKKINFMSLPIKHKFNCFKCGWNDIA